nr:hypothetical protein [Plantactinospora sp. KBS50]
MAVQPVFDPPLAVDAPAGGEPVGVPRVDSGADQVGASSFDPPPRQLHLVSMQLDQAEEPIAAGAQQITHASTARISTGAPEVVVVDRQGNHAH